MGPTRVDGDRFTVALCADTKASRQRSKMEDGQRWQRQPATRIATSPLSHSIMNNNDEDDSEPTVSRRGVLRGVSSAAMLGGLAAGYGAFGAIAVRYLYPARSQQTAWLYVTDVGHLKAGESLVFRTPSGARAAIARQNESGAASDFIALSSTCPHLGCQVHWEAAGNRFFCPCHNGAFDPSGKAIAGPPADAKQSLPRYPLKVEGALLFIEVPVEDIALGPGEIENVDLAQRSAASKQARS